MSDVQRWQTLIAASAATLAFAWLSAFVLRAEKVRRLLSSSLLAVWLLALLGFSAALDAPQRLFLASLVYLLLFKACAVMRRPRSQIGSMSWPGRFFAFLAWPGIDPTPFLPAREPAVENGRQFAAGMVRFIGGIVGLLMLAGFLPTMSEATATWIGCGLLLLAFHLGVTNLLTEACRAFGWRVPVLFNRPWDSASLSDFWSHRWNRPFVEMNRIFFMPAMTRRFGIRFAVFSAFLISGFLHELAISFPAHGGYGGPMLYFLIQGTLTLLERRLRIRGRLWTALVVLVPVPILFHQPFRHALILPMLQWLHRILLTVGVQSALAWGTIFLGLGHFCILFASSQVPRQLRWREELPRLSPLNQKLMWTYGAFIVFTITSFGVLTLVLREEIVRGTTAGLAVSTFIAAFWGFRLVVDTFYFRGDDWPKSPGMQIGHVFLNCLFTFLLLGNFAIIGWHMAHRFTGG